MYNDKKVFILFVVYLMYTLFLPGCKTTRISTSNDILYYQRKVTELETTVSKYEQRITIANQQIESDIDSLINIRERARTVGNTIDDIIKLFNEYQQGVERLLCDYNSLRNKDENKAENNNNTRNNINN